MTALHLAAGSNSCEVVELLIAYGADIHAKDNVSTTLIIANQFILFNVIRLLLERSLAIALDC